MFIMWTTALGLASAVCVTSFIEDFVYDTMRRGYIWQFAAVLFLLVFRHLEDSEGRLTFTNAAFQVHLSTLLREVEDLMAVQYMEVDDFFRPPPPPPPGAGGEVSLPPPLSSGTANLRLRPLRPATLSTAAATTRRTTSFPTALAATGTRATSGFRTRGLPATALGLTLALFALSNNRYQVVLAKYSTHRDFVTGVL